MSIPTLKKMDLIVSNPKRKRNRNWTLPPRRGQVKIRIFKTIFTSIGSTTVKEMPNKREERGRDLRSSRPTAAAITTGYTIQMPRRGQVKIRIFKIIFTSIASTTLTEMPKKREERGRELRSSSTTATTEYTIQMDY